MAELFDEVFNPSRVYNTLFFNVKPVLRYKTIEELKQEKPTLYERWVNLSKSRYDDRYPDDTKAQTIYEKHAIYYPEFGRIVAITYATLYVDEGKVKRYMKKIVNDDEFVVLATFIDELHQISSDGAHSNPQSFPTLCGHNIVGHDIPHLIKKFVLYRNRFENNKQIPLILKKSLTSKPWESNIIDTLNLWKFNGYEKTPLMLIADFLDLKKVVDLESLDEVSRKYWELVETEPEKALEYVSMQSATQTNFVIQIMNELRQL
jgi:3'-5' exonuclease